MILEKTLRWLVIGSIFALTIIPFIIAQTLFFPYITGKNFTFRVLVEIMSAGWLALVLISPAYRPRRSWVLGAVAVFTLIVALADAFGAYPFKSFWSNYERMDGWVTLAHLFLYIVVASSMLNTEKLWRAFWNVSLVMSLAIAAYSFLQLFGVVSLQAGFSSVERLDATFGNPIYLAVYMLFNVFIAALLWAGYWRESRPGSRWIFSTLYGSVIGIDCVVLLLTGTRGDILGLLVGVALSLLLVTMFARDSARLKKAAIGLLLCLSVLIGGFWLVRDSAWIQKVGFMRRLATISASDSTTKSRFYNWGMAWEGVKERPLLGWGQENYAVVFDKYYDPRMYQQEPWFDRVHNIVFDWLVAAGFLGLLSYLFIYAAALWGIWRSGAFDVLERSIITGLLAGYFFQNLFVFDNIMSYLLFASVIGYIASRESMRRGAPVLWKQSLPRSTLPFVVAGAVLALWASAAFVNGAALTQNRFLIQAINPQEGGVAKNLELMKQSLALHALGTQEAREQLVQLATKVAGTGGIESKVKQDFYDTAVAEMKLQEAASPLDARPALFLGLVYDAFGNYAAGKDALAHAHDLSPRKQAILYEIAQNADLRGDTAGVLGALKTAYELETTNIQARILYAAVLIRVGDFAQSDVLLAPIIPTGDAADPRIAAAYLAQKRYDKIAVVWEGHVKAQPDDPQGYFTLAAAYYGAGDRAKAISTLEAAVKKFPQAADQVASLIQQIRNGTLQIQ